MDTVNFGQALPNDRYKSSLEAPSRPLPSLDHIKDAISALRNNPRSVTLDTLEDVMTLRYLPEHLGVLTGPIIPSCIAILEQAGKYGKILDHKAGVLALQVLCFSFAAAFLVRNNYLDDFLESLDNERAQGYLPPFRCDLSIHIVAFLSQIMENIIKRGNQELSYGLAAAHDLLGWIKDSNDSSICLSELGGFDEHHALFLSEVLWAQRDSTMLMFRDVFLPGWSLVMHALWKHAVFLGGPRVM
ncbi:hypothetical protein FRC12_001892 [Ceratobasidium sp. 428]|nr:hypothetical protein FRC12_001892 [Ceratobasidium sp. 428]